MSDGWEPICKRNRDHTLSIGAASASTGSDRSRLSQDGASARRVAWADATRLGIHASKKKNRGRRDMRTPSGCLHLVMFRRQARWVYGAERHHVLHVQVVNVLFHQRRVEGQVETLLRVHVRHLECLV
jgi:hypothetical protein